MHPLRGPEDPCCPMCSSSFPHLKRLGCLLCPCDVSAVSICRKCVLVWCVAFLLSVSSQVGMIIASFESCLEHPMSCLFLCGKVCHGYVSVRSSTLTCLLSLPFFCFLMHGCMCSMFESLKAFSSLRYALVRHCGVMGHKFLSDYLWTT